MISINKKTKRPTQSPTVSMSPTITSSPTISSKPTQSPTLSMSPTTTLSPTISDKFYVVFDAPDGPICVKDCLQGSKQNCGGLAPSGTPLFDDRFECCHTMVHWAVEECMRPV